MAQGSLERFGQTLLGVRADLQPVHHDLDGVLLVLGKRGQLVHLVHLAVHAQPHEALGAQFVEQIQLLAFALDD